MAAVESAAVCWEHRYPTIFGRPGTLGKAKTLALTIDTGDAVPFKTRAYCTPL